MYDYNNESNEKQRLKSKKQIQHGVKIGSSLLHPRGTTAQCEDLPPPLPQVSQLPEKALLGWEEMSLLQS